MGITDYEQNIKHKNQICCSVTFIEGQGKNQAVIVNVLVHVSAA